MATWAPGDIITAAKLNLASVFVEDTTVATMTSATYGNSTRLLNLTITAPASGRIEVILAVRADNAGSFNSLSDMLITGSASGTIFSTPAGDSTAIQWASTSSAGPFTTARQVSCVPGEIVIVTAQHRVTGGTGNYRYRSITAKALVS